MNIFVRYCKKCKRAYDRGINYEICPKCREEELNKKEGKWKQKR